MCAALSATCKYCAGAHATRDCAHLKVSHDADACEVCAKRRRRRQRRTGGSSSGGGGGGGGTGAIFASEAYWDKRYSATSASEAGQGRNEWFVNFEALEVPLRAALRNTTDGCKVPGRVLEVGCGMSLLAESVAARALALQVEAIDISDACITRMRERQAARVGADCALPPPGRGGSPSSDANGGGKRMQQNIVVQYRCMDATAMSYDAAVFDVVIEKGTLDAVLTGDDSKNENEGDEQTAADRDSNINRPVHLKLLSEILRVLRPGGTFFVVSHSKGRNVMLERAGFLVEGTSVVVNGKAEYHCYTCCRPRVPVSASPMLASSTLPLPARSRTETEEDGK